jgi:hypothetical protein
MSLIQHGDCRGRLLWLGADQGHGVIIMGPLRPPPFWFGEHNFIVITILTGSLRPPNPSEKVDSDTEAKSVELIRSGEEDG